jgi:hypothetical protein
MRKRPPTVNKPMPDPSASVIAIAIPPSKANTPITAMVDRLTSEVPRNSLKSPAEDAQRLGARLVLVAPLRSPAGFSSRLLKNAEFG